MELQKKGGFSALQTCCAGGAAWGWLLTAAAYLYDGLGIA